MLFTLLSHRSLEVVRLRKRQTKKDEARDAMGRINAWGPQYPKGNFVSLVLENGLLVILSETEGHSLLGPRVVY